MKGKQEMPNSQICNHINCTCCEACAQICPKSCIFFRENDDGFRYPVIDAGQCVDCGLCRKICPVNSPVQPNQDSSFYMGWHRDDNIRSNSSSGGFFSALADYILNKGGVVFGASMDQSSRTVYHIMLSDRSGMQMLRLSKYYQSEIHNAYLQAKQFLDEDRMVLFTGTACQIAGLYRVCGKPSNLFTMDILCHGVTNKKVVHSYILSKEKQFGKKIKNYWFRTKAGNAGWQSGGGTRMKLQFTDDTIFVADKWEDTFFSGFNENLMLRESCYHCQYCGTQRIADFTAADFWGVTPKRAAEEERKKGISLLLANSEKARDLLEELRNDFVFSKIDPSEAIPYNRSLTEPNQRPEDRNKFFAYMRAGKDYDWIIHKLLWKKYTKIGIKKCIVKVIGESSFNHLKSQIKGHKKVKENG